MSFESAGVANYPASMANWTTRTEAAVAVIARSACANRTVRISFVIAFSND
jgi:hypothetical protein